MKAIYSSLILLLALTANSFSQRILAGEIRYSHISDLTYEFRINTISLNEPADFIQIDFGDGSTSSITSASESLGNNYFINSYLLFRTFSGPANYLVRVNCGYQMPGVVNSLLELNDPFYLYCMINIVDPLILGYNSSPVLLAGLNSVDEEDDVYSFSLNAYDPDGDELRFELSTFATYEGYDNFCTIPDATNYIGIDSILGSFLWDKPLSYGRYFFAVKIYEYRNDILLGWTMRTYMIDHYDPDASHDIFIYPDPASDFITINFGQNYFDQFGVNLYTISGQKIRGLNYQRPNNPTETIDISGLPPESYLLNLVIASNPISWVYIKPANKL